MSEKTNLTVVNLSWSVGVLLVALVGSVSVGWSQVRDLPNIISVALSLASMLLAVIAIVQTLVSSGSLTSSLSNISQAADNVLLVSRDLGSSAERFSGQMERLGSVPEKLDSVSSTINTLMQNARSVSGEPDLSTSTAASVGEFDIDEAAQRLTNGTMGALYALLWSHEKKKPFEFVDIDPSPNGVYKDGVIAGLKASGVMGIRQIEDGKFVVEELGPFSKEVILSWARDDNIADESRNFIERDFRKIEKFFGLDQSVRRPGTPARSRPKAQPKRVPKDQAKKRKPRSAT